MMKKIIYAALFSICVLADANASTTCVAGAENQWNGFTVEAFSQGEDCATAVVTIAIRDAHGKAIWVQAYIASQLLNFSQDPIADPKAMKKKLSRWISGEGFRQSVDRLNLKGEFPFTVSSDIDAKIFATLRKSKRPLFCYIQGIESGNCLTIDKDNNVIELGIQTFPG
jgi:hypothetical protein